MVFEGAFKKIKKKKVQGHFNEVLFSNFVFAWHSLQLLEQKEGLFLSLLM